ncbi:hypothetical protein [Chryseobacterium soldanellicola]|nr:hypothetical protein [Chryseobacterium soldanellicola]
MIAFLLMLLSNVIYSQVGIGTPTPRGALDINKPTTNNMGLVLPTNSSPNNIINPLGGKVIPGTMIYDSTLDCVRIYKGNNTWSNCFCECPAGGTVTTLSCGSATNTGTLASGTAASGVTSSIPYTGGNGGPYAAQSVSSTGVTGLTATLSAGNFATGNGNLTYTITGTPTGSGTASFAIVIGGQSCTFTRTVAGDGTITTLKCGYETNSGTLVSGTPASGVTSSVPYTGGNGGPYAAQSVSSTGLTGLTATLSAGNFANGNGNLIYTITGTPTRSGAANFTIVIGGKSCTITVFVGGSACMTDVSGQSFSSTNGTPITFNQPGTDGGFTLDLYTLDDSFDMSINGTWISNKQIYTYSYNSNQPATVRFADGTNYAGPLDANPNGVRVYSMTGTASNPVMRIIISATGSITMFGSKTSGGPLFPLELINGNYFDTVVWNTSTANTVTVTQSTVNPPTYISGYGSGKKSVPCP